VTTLVHQVTVSQWLTVSGFVVLFWDSLLVFPEELQRVWKTHLTEAKFAFLVNHYATLAMTALLTHAFSGFARIFGQHLSSNYCLGVTSLGLAGGVVSLGVGNYLVLLQVWQLWDQRALIRLLLTIGWAVSYSTTLVLACITIKQLSSSIVYIPGLEICALTEVPTLVKAVWVSPIAFEILVFVFTVWNALDRPRPLQSSLVRDLYMDGIVFFVSLFVLRVCNLVVTTVAPKPFIAVGSCLIWELNTVLLNRLILNQHVPLKEDDEVYTRVLDERRMTLSISVTV